VPAVKKGSFGAPVVHDLVTDLLKDEVGLVLIPREKGGKEMRLTMEKWLRIHGHGDRGWSLRRARRRLCSGPIAGRRR
jgi:hypothetical protein